MRISVVIFALALIAMLSATSCKRWYCCALPSSEYICTKDSVTYALVVTGTASNFQQHLNDSLSLYAANGYTCIEFNSLRPGEGDCTLTNARKKAAEDAGQVCSNAIGDDCGQRCGE